MPSQPLPPERNALPALQLHLHLPSKAVVVVTCVALW